jgi:RNA polymerase sigma-70 factor (ECF subfamily)
MSADLIERARGGDSGAFAELIGPHQAELRAHCYRMLGSLADADDALQDALLAAWQGLQGYRGDASIRTWLYKVTTTRCLNAIRSRSRRSPAPVPPGIAPPAPTRLAEVTWLEPFPDALLTGIADGAPGPEARYEAREAISLAFVTAVQLLPPRQRAALLLRDVLGYSAREAAGILGGTEESVTSALRRARTAVKESAPPCGQAKPVTSSVETQLAERLTRAYQAGDVAAIIALFAEDAWLRMPPVPLEYQGRALIGEFLRVVAFRDGRTYRLARTRANGQLAFESYLPAATWPNDLLVLTLTASPGDGAPIAAMTRFRPRPPAIPRNGLPGPDNRRPGPGADLARGLCHNERVTTKPIRGSGSISTRIRLWETGLLPGRTRSARLG